MHRTPLLSALALCASALCAPAQTLVRAVNGPAANAMYGKASVVVPDQNGDGYKDLLVGAPGFNSLRGAIFVSRASTSRPAQARKLCGRWHRPRTKATCSGSPSLTWAT
jgi:hypothetical protein